MSKIAIPVLHIMILYSNVIKTVGRTFLFGMLTVTGIDLS